MSDTLAAVLTREPDWSALPRTTPAPIRRLLRRCLEKDPPAAAGRYRRRAAGHRGSHSRAVGLRAEPHQARTCAAALGVVAQSLPWGHVAAAFGSRVCASGVGRHGAQRRRRTSRAATITTSGPSALTISGASTATWPSRPTARISSTSATRGRSSFVRALDALEPVAIVNGYSARCRSSRQMGCGPASWTAITTVKKVAITGGPPITVARISTAGAHEAPPGRRTTRSFSRRTAAATGPAAACRPGRDAGGGVLTRPDHVRGEADHVWPEILPGGRAVLFTITTQTGGRRDAAQVAVLDLRTRVTQKILVGGGSHAHYVSGAATSCTHGGRTSAPSPSISTGWRPVGRRCQ